MNGNGNHPSPITPAISMPFSLTAKPGSRQALIVQAQRAIQALCEMLEDLQAQPQPQPGPEIARAKAELDPDLNVPSCPQCGDTMKQRASKFGPFWGCINYPTCDGIVKIRKPSRTTHAPIPSPRVLEFTNRMKRASNRAQLQQIYIEAYKEARDAGDENAQAAYIRVKDARKRELQ
jgi:ssDNA-binding Zn-finger/Zn-ribbon topoisomerase 1